MRKNIMMNNLELHDVNPLTCGTQNCLPGHAWGPSVRGYYLLHYVHRGRGIFESPRFTGQVTAGQMFVIRPQVTCSYAADRDAPWEYSWVGFSCRYPLDNVLTGDVIDAQGCSHIFRALLSAEHIEQRREWFICGKIYELLAILGGAAAPSQGGSRREAARYVRMARNYIENQYMEPVKINQIAQHLNLNRSYFSRIFKEHTGKSPQDYLVDFRLEKAAELLSAQNLPAGEVARLVGYNDLFNFSRMFRRRYGVPPSSYRQRVADPKL